PTRDYYSLYGVFAGSVEPAELPLLKKRDPSLGPTPYEKELALRQGRVTKFLEEQGGKVRAQARKEAEKFLLAASDTKRYPGEPAMLTRWRQYLLRHERRHSPVLAPVLKFAALSRAEFAAKAPALAATIAKNADKSKPINPLVAKAFAGKPPTTLTDVVKK